MGTVSKPNTFSANTTISSSEVNDNFDTIYSEFNGNISANNLASAAVTTAKITDSAVTTAKINAGAVTPAKTDSTLLSGWVAGTLAAPNTVTYNGNRSYTLTFNSTDLTGTLSPGMRLKLTRTVTAPTQCTSLNGTTQYYNKTSPAGMTFTDDFTVTAWVKLTSYASASIASRYNGTSGWDLSILSTGQLQLASFNAGAANFSAVGSVQSLPLNKWIHVQANLDMSAFTTNTDGGASGSTIAFDGVNVPSTVSRGGTNPTSLVQAGNLEIGSRNGGTNFWPGKIAQVAIYNSKITIANVVSTISQGLAGTETSLISAYSFNNSINDLNSNANNLTAQGSAVATNADTPFGQTLSLTGYTNGSLCYGIITSASFSTNTTLVVQVPEGDTIPTSGGVSAMSYSTQDNPYGFTKDKNKWRLTSIWGNNSPTTSNATYGSFQSGGWALTVPVGTWDVGHQASYYNNTTTGVYFNISSTALTGLSKTTGQDASPFGVFVQSSAAATGANTAHIRQPQTLAAAATYVMYTQGATTSAAVEGDGALAEIYAEFTLL